MRFSTSQLDSPATIAHGYAFNQDVTIQLNSSMLSSYQYRGEHRCDWADIELSKLRVAEPIQSKFILNDAFYSLDQYKAACDLL